MREIRTSGSEGGGAKTLPTPIGLRSEAGKVLILTPMTRRWLVRADEGTLARFAQGRKKDGPRGKRTSTRLGMKQSSM